MVHWGWIVIALFVGVFFGAFLIAFLEVSREEDQKNGKRWWEE